MSRDVSTEEKLIRMLIDRPGPTRDAGPLVQDENIEVEEKPTLRVLLICDYRPLEAATVVDHINAFYQYSRHEVYVLSGLIQQLGNFPARKVTIDDQEVEREYDLEHFDVIIVHYSMALALNSYISAQAKHKLRQFTGLKALFIQDEYRFVDRTINTVLDLGIGLIFTCVPDDQIELVYPTERLPGVRKENVLTGYISESILLFPMTPIHERPIDISYRGRKYPAWHGELGLQKWSIAKAFLRYRRRFGLKLDISYREKDRVYGINWVNLLKKSKAVLGVESGASVFDFDGTISAKTETFESLIGDKRVNYEELREKFFAEHENKIRLNQISPRLFEAIALGTLLIIYEGEYSGVLQPWRHYLPVKLDHSNIPELLDFLKKDERGVAEIVTNAYTEIALDPKYSFQTFIGGIDDIFEELVDYERVRNRVRKQKIRYLKRKLFDIGESSGFRTLDDFEALEAEPVYDRFEGAYFTPYPHSIGHTPGEKIRQRLVKIGKRLLLRR